MGLKLTLLHVAQLSDNCIAYYGLAFPSLPLAMVILKLYTL
jgi:hypothetical protein